MLLTSAAGLVVASAMALPRPGAAQQLPSPPMVIAQNGAADPVVRSAPLPQLSDPPAGNGRPAGAVPGASADESSDWTLDPLESQGSVREIEAPVEAHPLGGLPPRGVGLIDDRQGGLGAMVWHGSAASTLSALMARLPAPVPEPLLRDLQRRLLLTRAAAPGAFGADDPLVPLRAERLRAMGFDQEAASLAGSLPDEAFGDPRQAFDRALLAGNDDRACRLTQDAIVTATDSYWKMALIYCQIATGQQDQAALGLDLLRENPLDAAGADFIVLAEALLGQAPAGKMRVTQTPDPLRAAMMRKAGLPAERILGLGTPWPTGPAGDAARARDAGLPVIDRVRHAERAFRMGLIGAEEMAGIYRLVPVVGDVMARNDGPRARAQLFQIVERGPDLAARGQALARLLSMARQSATFAEMAPLHARAIERLPVGADLAWLAPEAFRTLLLAGKRDVASYWLNLAQGTRRAPQTTQAVPGMEILAQWAGIVGCYDSDPVEIWRATTGANEGAAGRLYAIYRALGQPIAAAGAHSLVGLSIGDGGDLADAVASGRRGETVLRILVGLGHQNLESADIAQVAQAIGGLSGVGLLAESRDLAVAAGIASGL